VDIVDGTPLLDIKPYVPDFESKEQIRIGWLTARRDRIRDKQSDGRFFGGQHGP
jgi:tRNA (Thr-GGU) A37 N-methylase